MANEIPKTSQLFEQYLAIFEGKINQTSPLNEKAFLRALSQILAMSGTQFNKLGAERILQNLIKTASGSDLDRLGSEPGLDITRIPAEAAQLTATIPGTDEVTIPVTIDFVGVGNGVRYNLDAAATVIGGIATLQLTAQDLGIIGNLNLGDTLIIGTQVAGVETIATVTVITNIGAEEETDDNYRERIATKAAGATGGGNAQDYKIWAEEVAGVAEAYPFSGEPFDDPPPTSFPSDRTVYVESTQDINQDGIPPASLLTEVRAALNTDPVTGLSRPPLGDIDDTLFVEAITRTPIYVTISGISTDPDVLAATKNQILSALTTHIYNVPMFVAGIDPPQDRADTITPLTLSDVVQDILVANGGTAEKVVFGDSPGGNLPGYTLDPGELTKLGSIVYD
jgi:phage-related baseplate assembly protein